MYRLTPKDDVVDCGVSIQNSHDREIFSQITTPDMVQVTNLQTSPTNDNLGISLTSTDTNQIRTSVSTPSGMYTVYEQTDKKPNLTSEPQTPQPWNVFDPRDHGYGTSYRHYMDPVTGQPRYYYDDIDAVRRPSMIYRSNIDYMNEYLPDTHGSLNPDEYYRQASQMQREDLQRTITRKYNEERGWQLRKAPMYTNQTNFR